jgi:dihydrofolate synthase/folylpolyglutamate synthase
MKMLRHGQGITMTYEDALEYIHGAWKFGNKLGLHNMEKLLGLMGNPQKKLRIYRKEL